MRESPLARILFAVYVALVVYASLYPLAGWRDHGLPLLAYLSAPWSRFVTGFDVAANLLGYVPYGFLRLARADTARRRRESRTARSRGGWPRRRTR